MKIYGALVQFLSLKQPKQTDASIDILCNILHEQNYNDKR